MLKKLLEGSRTRLYLIGISAAIITAIIPELHVKHILSIVLIAYAIISLAFGNILFGALWGEDVKKENRPKLFATAIIVYLLAALFVYINFK